MDYTFDDKQKLWACNKCKKVSKKKRDIIEHVNKKNPCVKILNLPKFQCYKCLKKFDIKRDYERHLGRKTDCALSLNAPLNNVKKTEVVNWEEKCNFLEKQLELQEHHYQQQILLLEEKLDAQQAEIISIQEICDANLTNYVEHLLNPKDIKCSYVTYYLFTILIQLQEKESKLKNVYNFLLDRTSIQFLSSICKNIQELDKEQKDLFILFTQEYLDNLDKKKLNQKLLFGKNIILYIDNLRNLIKILKDEMNVNPETFFV
jgi:uncharacterized C2H2 Zn-finger protein